MNKISYRQKTLQLIQMQLVCMHTYMCVTYSTAQRQLDTRTHAEGWILLGEDYIIGLIFEWAPITFMPVLGKLSCMCIREHYIILYELLNEIYNINSIYTMNLRILSLYVVINPWIHCHGPTEKLLACIMSHALLFGWVWRMDLVQRMDSSLVIESPLTSSSMSSQLV